MRYVNVALGALMVLFAAVQWNDPDGPLWMAVYLVPAAWAFAAALRPERLRSTAGSVLLGVTLAAALGALVYYWPAAPEFWRKDVWWEDEGAREGMGVMLALVVLVCAALGAFRARTSGS